MKELGKNSKKGERGKRDNMYFLFRALFIHVLSSAQENTLL